jgi:hypothetical protein
MYDTLTEELAFIRATQEHPELDGKQWERIYARCIQTEYAPSNRKVVDVEKGRQGFSLKTIKTGRRLHDIEKIRIIQCRPDPRLIKVGGWRTSPQSTGDRIIQDWNRQVGALKESFDKLTEVVLIRSLDFNSFCLCEYDIECLNEADYTWEWNKRGNLQGYDKSMNHCFTWQHGGSQWTVIKSVVPKQSINFFNDPASPERIIMSKREVLNLIGYEINVKKA